MDPQAPKMAHLQKPGLHGMTRRVPGSELVLGLT